MIMHKNTKWSIDQQHSGISFKVRHMMIAHIKGVFRKFDASIYITNNDFTTAEIDLWIDAASIDTGNKERDDHLRSADFFDVAKYPQISFVSSTIGKQDEKGHHVLWGELTIKGVSKAIQLNVEFGGVIKDPWGVEKSGFQVDGKVNRSDWGIIFNSPLESGGVLVGEEVTISCEMELMNESPEELKMELDDKSGDDHIM
jgi:polyisoprenoid-binding protein YceI